MYISNLRLSNADRLPLQPRNETMPMGKGTAAASTGLRSSHLAWIIIAASILAILIGLTILLLSKWYFAGVQKKECHEFKLSTLTRLHGHGGGISTHPPYVHDVRASPRHDVVLPTLPYTSDPSRSLDAAKESSNGYDSDPDSPRAFRRRRSIRSARSASAASARGQSTANEASSDNALGLQLSLGELGESFALERTKAWASTMSLHTMNSDSSHSKDPSTSPSSSSRSMNDPELTSPLSVTPNHLADGKPRSTYNHASDFGLDYSKNEAPSTRDEFSSPIHFSLGFDEHEYHSPEVFIRKEATIS